MAELFEAELSSPEQATNVEITSTAEALNTIEVVSSCRHSAERESRIEEIEEDMSATSDEEQSLIDERERLLGNDNSGATNIKKKDEVFIVLAGKSGAGKSTLFDSLLDQKKANTISPDPVTEAAESNSIEKNGVTLNIIDTPGLEDSGKEVKNPQKKFDLLLFCLTVSPGCKFRDANPTIMRKLQQMYGSNIWKHCVVIFTFSNLAWDRIKEKEDAAVEYKVCLEKYTKKFQEKLKEMKVKNVMIKTIFSHGKDKPSDPNIIVAIPAGDKPKDPVLPGIETSGWIDEIFNEMIRKCKCRGKLVQYRYGRQSVDRILMKLGIIGGTTSVVTTPATLLGAGIGAAAGIPGGPAGMIAGAAAGGLGGLATGALITTVASKKIIKDSM